MDLMEDKQSAKMNLIDGIAQKEIKKAAHLYSFFELI
jgi:hypothetical protein